MLLLLSGAGQNQPMKARSSLGFYGIEHLPPAVLHSADRRLGAAGITTRQSRSTFAAGVTLAIIGGDRSRYNNA